MANATNRLARSHSEQAPAGFRDRRDAGRYLAAQLTAYADRPDVVVLGIPRGGVPVAFEVADALRAPLDIVVVRKLGLPFQPELAMGAIASGGVRILNRDVLSDLEISPAVIDEVAAREQVELERREHSYRSGRAAVELAGKTVIVVDDGLATGSTMLAAIGAVRQRGAAAVVCAVPVAAPSSLAKVSPQVDELVCVIASDDFFAVGQWYLDFPQTSDEEVRDLLAQAQGAQAPPQPRKPKAA
jgi:putative phosphoribosyl transferase